MSLRVLFDGGYTLRSAGDDAPLTFLADGLRSRVAEELECTVIARHPSREFDRWYDVRSVAGLEYDSKAASAGKWFRGLNFDDDRDQLRGVADVVAESDLLVLGAGNFLTEVGIDVLRGHLPRFAVMIAIAQLAGTPTMLYGLSANRLRDPWTARTARWLLDAADAVTFREGRAVENLTAAGIDLPSYELLPDPALGAREASAGRAREILAAESIPPGQGARMAVAPRDLSWLDLNDDYVAGQVEVINGWLAASPLADVIVIPQCTYEDAPQTDDRVIGGTLAARSADPSRVHIVESHLPHWDVEACYDAADVVVATRLHGSVFAARRGRPVVGLAYEQKVAGFFDTLELPQLCLPVSAPPERILEAVHRAHKDAPQLSPVLLERTAGLRTRLGRYLDIALELLERPRPRRP